MLKFLFFFVFVISFSSAEGALEPAQQFEGFNLVGYTKGGEKAWDVNGDTADIQGDTIEITNVDANSFGQDPMNLKARKGTIHKTAGDIQLKHDVVITAQKGTQLKTDSLNWQKEKDLVTTDDQVTLTDKGLEATGTGLTAHPALKTAQMNKDVTVKVNSEPENPTGGQMVTITSDGPMEIDQMNNLATFKDNVVAVQGEYTLKSDKMEIYFDPKNKKISQTVCLGHVVIEQGKNQTFAQKAVYQASTQKLILTGQPKLIMVTAESGNIFGKTE